MAQHQRKPNLLLIVCDQLRPDHVGFGGSRLARTPNLDALAANGRVFHQARVANPICMPNRASLLTGRAPSSHGVTSNRDALCPTANTLPRQLRDHGYRTALIGKGDLQNGLRRALEPEPEHTPAVADPFPPGWDEVEDAQRYLQNGVSDPTDYYGFEHIALTLGHADMVGGHHLRWALARGATLEQLTQAGPGYARQVNQYWWQVYQPRISEELYSTTFVTESTMAAIDSLSASDDPWFIQCSFPDPHHPFTAPGRWHHRHRAEDVELPPTFWDYGRNAPDHLAGFRTLPASFMPVQMFGPTPEQFRAAAAAEAGAIEFIDHGVGRILETLRHSRGGENTVVVFTSDHGDMFGDHGLMLKGMMHYSGCLRIPLVFNGPDIVPGATDCLASTLDLTPTLLGLAGAARFDDVAGVDLADTLHDPGRPTREAVYVEEEFPQATLFEFPVPRSARTLITDRYRLTRYCGTPLGELYDLADDPDESVNRWAEPGFAEVRLALTEQLLDMSIEHSQPARIRQLSRRS